MTSLPPCRVRSAKLPVCGRYVKPLEAVPAVKNFGELMSTDFEVTRSMMDTLRPNSEKTQTSLSSDPKLICTGIVFSDVGLLICAENCESVTEYTRISSLLASSKRFEVSAQMNQRVAVANSDGKLTLRMDSSDLVALTTNFVFINVAI